MNLAAILSANGEKNQEMCYKINVNGFKNVCESAVDNKVALYNIIY